MPSKSLWRFQVDPDHSPPPEPPGSPRRDPREADGPLDSRGDQRILGKSEFVMDVLSESEGRFYRRYALNELGYDYEKVLGKVSELFHLDEDYITGSPDRTSPLKLLRILDHDDL